VASLRFTQDVYGTRQTIVAAKPRQAKVDQASGPIGRRTIVFRPLPYAYQPLCDCTIDIRDRDDNSKALGLRVSGEWGGCTSDRCTRKS
jgi:hypothetical protein